MELKIHRFRRHAAHEARGVVLVIDVIRAFSVAAYAFAGGAERLWLVRTVEEAMALRTREPEAFLSLRPPRSAPLLAGEVNGRLIEGFNFNNSPALMAKADVHGRLIIQRTGAGTQGAVDASNATHLLLCSLVNARATATYAHKLAETTNGIITLMPTATIDVEVGANRFEDGPNRFEDDICADYLEALLLGQADASEKLAEGVARLRASGRFEAFEQGHSDFPFEDIAAFLAVDLFSFVMVGARQQWHEITYVDVQKVDVDG